MNIHRKSIAPARKRASLRSSLALLAVLSVASVPFPAQVQAQAQAQARVSGAEKIRELNIMLMVTGLRCRRTPDNFLAEYRDFTARHIGDLNAATDELLREIAERKRAANPYGELDRLSTVMANTYGEGHPWLSCGELKEIAGELAGAPGSQVLEDAADSLLVDTHLPRFAYARR